MKIGSRLSTPAATKSMGVLASRNGGRFSGPGNVLDRWPIVDVLLAGALVVICYWLAPDIEGGSSMNRKAALLMVCGIVIVYGILFSPLAPIYAWAFMAQLYGGDGISKALIGCSIITLLLGRKKVGWRWRFSALGLAFCLWSAGSLLWAATVVVESGGFLYTVLPLIIMAMIVAGIQDPLLPRKMGFVIACAAVIGGVETLRSWGSGETTIYNVTGRYQSFLRPDIFSSWCAWGLLVMMALVPERPQDHRRGLAVLGPVAVSIFLGIVLLLSGIRSSIVAAMIGLLVLFWYARRYWSGAILVAVMAGAITLFAYVYENPFEQVQQRFNSMSEDRGTHRLDIWTAGLKLVSENFIFGIGWDNFRFEVSKYYNGEVVAHNIFLSTLIELGLVGELLMLGWFFTMLRLVRKSAEPGFLLPVFVAFLFQGLLLHQFIVPYFWLALGLAEGTRLPTFGDAEPSVASK